MSHGAQLYFEAEGEGSPVVMIHAGVAHLRMWDAQVAAWRDRHRVIRYDTRGFGRTLTKDVPYSNRADLAAVMDHFGLEQAHVVGISRGSMIALDFAVENPERVKSLVWVAGGLRGFEPGEDPRLAAIWPEMERLEEAEGLGAAGRARDADLDRWTGPAAGPRGPAAAPADGRVEP